MDTRDGRIYKIPEELREASDKADGGESIKKFIDQLDEIEGIEEIDMEYIKPMKHHPTPTQRARRKVGRNDVCPCGSGKKFKKCCLFGAGGTR